MTGVLPERTAPRRRDPWLGAAVAAALLGAPGPAGAQGTAEPVTYDDVDRATVRVFAVGDVHARRDEDRRVDAPDGVVDAGHGSGIFVAPTVVATAAHVVEGAHHVAVRLPRNAGLRPAVVQVLDTERDFALLVIGGPPSPHWVPLPVSPRPLRSRETVFAVGYPMVSQREEPQSSAGIVSGNLRGLLQLNVDVSPGNSGGPLLDAGQRLVGLVIAKHTLAEGMAFAVPAAPLRVAWDALAATDRVGATRRALAPRAAALETEAQAVDLLVRLDRGVAFRGSLQALREGSRPWWLAPMDALAARLVDGRLLLGLAARTWTAALDALETAGIADDPDDAARLRAMAAGLAREAAAIVARAERVDPGMASGHPLARVVRRGLPPDARASAWSRATAPPARPPAPIPRTTAPRASASPAAAPKPASPSRGATVAPSPAATPERMTRRPPPPAGAPVEVAPAPPPAPPDAPGKGWYPLVYGGLAVDLSRDTVRVLGIDAGTMLPLVMTGDRQSGARIALGLGAAFTWMAYESPTPLTGSFDVFDVRGLLGFLVRLGGPRGALFVQAAWSPGARRGALSAAQGAWEPSLQSYDLAIGPQIRRFFVAFGARLVRTELPWHPGLFEPAPTRWLTFVGARLGVSY